MDTPAPGFLKGSEETLLLLDDIYQVSRQSHGDSAMVEAAADQRPLINALIRIGYLKLVKQGGPHTDIWLSRAPISPFTQRGWATSVELTQEGLQVARERAELNALRKSLAT